MAVTLIVVVAVAAVVLAGIARWLRSDPHADVSRFHHARDLTSSWSQTYAGVAEPEEPEASEDKPELQHSVHRVEAA